MARLLPAACLALALTACLREASPPAGAASGEVAPADTLRGLLEITGSEPASRVVIRGVDGEADVPLLGDPRVLRALTGVEVMVCGGRGPDGFRVDAVTVRAVDRIAVERVEPRPDGNSVVVLRDGRTLVLPPRATPPDRCRVREEGG